ncbi:mesaconyl-C4 CoA hydratase [Micromonospora zingiberis]|uniref:Mesaconyl-C4 CoA hydratase n=1 Tax=Micromonospora zingiberis TaxID=2053011 RepID=A0A4R0GKW7_9ACTN|nr:mesaconyl-C4 CoA hydratase [Micromonospora zingiberis]TCB97212.1 mesaconyl-C4 CoA hydratase [Micromonospora zingiberis]
MDEQVRHRTGTVDPYPSQALAALLDVPLTAEPDSAVPPMWHWVYLLDAWRQSELGTDGHPRHGVPAPPAPGVRRMFAGGRTTHLRPLRFGRPATKISSVVSRQDKHGRSGPLSFVTVRHTITQSGQLAVLEEQDIVYRPQAAGQGRPAGAGPGPSEDEPPPLDRSHFTVDPVVLFRFSALTGNTHRIHYDQRYAATEGYADLVVHGPLQVVLMADFLRRAGVELLGRSLHYRLLAPAIGAQRLEIRRLTSGHRPGPAAQVRAQTGELVSQAELRDPDPTIETDVE